MMRAIGCLLVLGLLGGCAGTQPKREAATVQVVPIRNVGADDLAAELVKQAGLRGGDTIRVTVDPRTNSLILQGSPDWIEKMKQRIGELDQGKPPQH
jgi:type II secretory pathway component GspD/PulD (secretin)